MNSFIWQCPHSWHIEASVLRQSRLPTTLQCIVWPRNHRTPACLICDLYMDYEKGRWCVCGNASVTVCARDVLGRSTAFCRPLCRWETGMFYGMLISEGDGTCIPTIGLRQEGKHTRATPLSLLGVTRCDLHFGWDTSAPELLVM
jgi:hypothetical protein